ncbi:MAG: hypothetical protein ABEI75_01525 [Halobaculum sp.]
MERTRRGVLTAVGVGGVGALAGCVGGSGAGTATPSSDAVLAYVRVANYDDASHTVHVLVERADEIVHWSSHDLPAGDGEPVTRRLSGPWGESGPYTIHTRLGETGDRRTFPVDPGETDCYGVETRVTSDGTQSLWFEQSPPGCTASEG